jgi:hypothetical protein
MTIIPKSSVSRHSSLGVIPAQAGIQGNDAAFWIPAYAGMTEAAFPGNENSVVRLDADPLY